MKKFLTYASAFIFALFFVIPSSASAVSLAGGCTGSSTPSGPTCTGESQAFNDASAALSAATEEFDGLMEDVNGKLEAWHEAAAIVDDTYVNWQDMLANEEEIFDDIEETYFINLCDYVLAVLYGDLFSSEERMSLCTQYYADPGTFQMQYPAFRFEPLSLIPAYALEHATNQVEIILTSAEDAYNSALETREGHLFNTEEENGESGYYELWGSCDDPKLNVFIAQKAMDAAQVELSDCQAAAADAAVNTASASSCLSISVSTASTALLR